MEIFDDLVGNRQEDGASINEESTLKVSVSVPFIDSNKRRISEKYAEHTKNEAW